MKKLLLASVLTIVALSTAQAQQNQGKGCRKACKESGGEATTTENGKECSCEKFNNRMEKREERQENRQERKATRKARREM